MGKNVSADLIIVTIPYSIKESGKKVLSVETSLLGTNANIYSSRSIIPHF